jgi:sigma-54 specific flagellar transcriptional regulator A
MDTHSHYLVTDDCDHCHYIANAFALLKLPLKSVDDLTNLANSTTISQAVSVILCKNTAATVIKQLDDIFSAHPDVLFIIFDKGNAHHDKLHNPVHILPSDFSIDELKSVLAQSTNRQNFATNQEDLSHPIFDRLVGKSEQILKIKSFIKQVADSDATVLILGESGTGKDVIASCIHYLSNRHENLLVPINCGAIPSELMESELFGHEKGAFTGALTRRAGRFEIASGGTLFLDEIGDMPMPMQVKLLRVIQDRKIERVGGNTSIDVDVRLVAATNKNLEALIQENKFREDLFYRLNVFPIQVPSLSERADDLPLLIDYHLDRIAERLNHRVAFTERALEILGDYAWPGNIRELANFLERMVILHRDCVLDEKDLDPIYKKSKHTPLPAEDIHPTDQSFDIKRYIAHIEQQLLQKANADRES